MRRGRTDSNQIEIVAALRAIGCSVLSISDMGKGAPDLVVGWQGRNYLLEVKDGTKAPSARRLTPDEREWIGAWRGMVTVVESVDEALNAIRGKP